MYESNLQAIELCELFIQTKAKKLEDKINSKFKIVNFSSNNVKFI